MSSVMLNLTQFVERLNPDNQFTHIEVVIDTKLYSNTFGINVRPIQLTLWNNTNRKLMMSMQDIIDKFSGICYIRVNESTHRRLSREPTCIIINTSPKTFNGYTYYDYRINKLFLLDELTRYNKIHETSHEVMKRYKESNEPTEPVEQQGSEID